MARRIRCVRPVVVVNLFQLLLSLVSVCVIVCVTVATRVRKLNLTRTVAAVTARGEMAFCGGLRVRSLCRLILSFRGEPEVF